MTESRETMQVIAKLYARVEQKEKTLMAIRKRARAAIAEYDASRCDYKPAMEELRKFLESETE